MKASSIKNYGIVMFLFAILFVSPVSAETISGFNDLLTKLPGGISNKEEKASAIKHGQTFVISRQARKKRKLIFNKPLDALRLNEKYTSIAFNTTITVKTKGNKVIKEPAVFSLLFVNGEKNAFDFSNGKYIGWIGEKDISDYQKITPNKLCKYYRNAGVKDCIYKKVLLMAVYGRKKNQLKKISNKKPIYRAEFESRLKEKADIVHTHDGADITAGLVTLANIDTAGLVKTEALAGIVSKITLGQKTSDNSITVNKADYDKLKAKILQLEKTVKHLSAILSGVSRKGSEIIFSRVNMHLVNGTGSTDGITNGLGNLIIGYNNPIKQPGQGSHNLCIGKGNNFSSYGGLVSGEKNVISGKYAVAVGGSSNTAKGAFSSVTGGTKNKAMGKLSNISGGTNRSVSGTNPHFIKK